MGRAVSENSTILQLKFDDKGVKSALVAIASAHGYSTLKDWLQAVAQGDLAMISDSVQQALLDAITALSETGKLGSASLLVSWLSAQVVSESTQKRLSELQDYPQWGIDALRLIDERQAFSLHYHGKDYLVRAGEIIEGDRRLYLLAWCEGVEDRSDEPEGLKNNRLFRLDEDASVSPIEKEWIQEGVGAIEVSLLLTGRLASRYTRKPEDVAVIELGNSQLQVVKRVKSMFSFEQTVLQYGSNCRVVAPAQAVERVKAKIASLASLYE
jgi:WYL domain